MHDPATEAALCGPRLSFSLPLNHPSLLEDQACCNARYETSETVCWVSPILKSAASVEARLSRGTTASHAPGVGMILL